MGIVQLIPVSLQNKMLLWKEYYHLFYWIKHFFSSTRTFYTKYYMRFHTKTSNGSCSGWSGSYNTLPLYPLSVHLCSWVPFPNL